MLATLIAGRQRARGARLPAAPSQQQTGALRLPRACVTGKVLRGWHGMLDVGCGRQAQGMHMQVLALKPARQLPKCAGSHVDLPAACNSKEEEANAASA